MTYDEQPDTGSGLYVSSAALTPQRSARRRKQAIVAVAGAAAVLAGSGFLVTQLMNERQPTLPEPAALAPLTPPAASESTPVVAAPSPTRTPKTTRQAAPVQISPAPPPPPASVAAAYPQGYADPGGGQPPPIEQIYPEPMLGDQRIRERTEAVGAGTIRIVSARRDLTGERLSLISRDDGQAAGRGVRCTTEMRFGTGLPAAAQGILVCWRTSEGRSVITIGQDVDTTESVDVISREWLTLD